MVGINQSNVQAESNRAIFNKIKGRDGVHKPACICHTDFDHMIIKEVGMLTKEDSDEPTQHCGD